MKRPMKTLMCLILLGWSTARAYEPEPPEVPTTLKFVLLEPTRGPSKKLNLRIERAAHSFLLTLRVNDVESAQIRLVDWMERAKFLSGLEPLSSLTARAREQEADGKNADGLRAIIEKSRRADWRIERIYSTLRDQLHGKEAAPAEWEVVPNPEESNLFIRAYFRRSLAVLPFFFELDDKGSIKMVDNRLEIESGIKVSDLFDQEYVLSIPPLFYQASRLKPDELAPSHQLRFTAVKFQIEVNRERVDISYGPLGNTEEQVIGFFADGKMQLEMPMGRWMSITRRLLLLDSIEPYRARLNAMNPDDPDLPELKKFLTYYEEALEPANSVYLKLRNALTAAGEPVVFPDIDREILQKMVMAHGFSEERFTRDQLKMEAEQKLGVLRGKDLAKRKDDLSRQEQKLEEASNMVKNWSKRRGLEKLLPPGKIDRNAWHH